MFLNQIRKLRDRCTAQCLPIEGSPNVFVNGIPAVRVGDKYECDKPAIQGSRNVYINNRRAHRRTDLIQCGERADNGSPNVFIGG